MKHWGFVSWAVAALFVVGCGGGGGTGAGTPEPEVGAGQVRLAGQLREPLFDSVGGGLSVYGFTGAITKAYWSDTNPSVADSELVFSMQSIRGDELWACEPDGSNPRLLASLALTVTQIIVSHDGVWCYFIEGGNLKRVAMAGGAVTTVLNDVANFCLTPTSTRAVVYRSNTDTLSVVNVNGTGLVNRLTSAGQQTRIFGCLTEDKALYAQNGFLTNPNVFTITLSGTLVQQNQFSFANHNIESATLDNSRDNVYLRYYSQAEMKTYWGVAPLSKIGSTVQPIRDDLVSGDYARSLTFSPDGTTLVGARVGTLGSTTLAIYDKNYNITSTIRQLANTNSEAAWAPSPTFRTFVGAGNYASGAAVLLFTDKNSRTPSVVLADATTRASMTLQRVSQDGDPNVVYQLSCDNLTKLHYTKSNNFAQISVVGSITGLKGAFIAFNAETGRVNNVVTFAKQPTIDRTPQGIELKGGELVDRFDGEGNRKPISPRIVL